MSHLLEVLVTCDSNNTIWTCCIWDPHNGTNLMTYKGGGTAETRTLNFIANDYLAAVEKTKPVLHIWPLNSKQTVQGMRFILPGKASSLAVTSDGSYCIAGIDENIYLWQMSSGNLLTIINRHYQKVNLLKFTSDGRFFVSAAEDGMVMVWSITTVAANPEVELLIQTTAGQHDPVYIFSDHSLPVTDMCLSKAGMHGRLFTVSSDRSCKVYDLTCGEILLNFVFDEPLSSITIDVLELNVFIGSTLGKIYKFNLTHAPKNRDVLINNESNNAIFSCHTKAVSCLSVSLNGEILMSGSNDEQVILWHIASRQPVRFIKHKGAITNAFFTTNYEAIYKQEFNPTIVLHSLERALESNSEETNEIEVLINKKNKFWPHMEENNEMYVDTPHISKDINNVLNESEAPLKEELEKLKRINANLYSLSIEKVLDSVAGENNVKVDNESKKKRKNKKKINFT